MKNAFFRLLRGEHRIPAGYFCLALSVVLATVYNIPFWRETIAARGGVTPGSVLFLASFWVLITALLNVFITAFCAKFILRPIAILLVVSASIALYFIWAYGVMIDRPMIENVLQTNAEEIRDLLSPTAFTFVSLTGLLPAYLIARMRIAYLPFVRQLSLNVLNITASLVVSAAVIFSLYGDLASISQNHRHLRSLLIPSNYVYPLISHIMRSGRVDGPLMSVGADAVKAASWQAHKRRSVTVLVLGETARAMNFGIYGYPRDTTPSLRRKNIIAFDRFYSCGTSTAVSLPCMFSMAPHSHSGRETRGRENILDIISRSGIKVIWRDNNSGCKEVCSRVRFEDLSTLKTETDCNTEECYDEILLNGLNTIIQQSNDDLFIVLHQKGSHGPAYYKRVPERFKLFKPMCNDNELKHCSPEEIVSAYDNTILYTDYILGRVIETLKPWESLYDTAMLYVSDHGESLGERRLYLHGTPYALAPEEQIHIPFLIWLSEEYKSDFGINEQCLKQRTSRMYGHENLFHSLLGMLDISTVDYNPNLDIFAGCTVRRDAQTVVRSNGLD